MLSPTRPEDLELARSRGDRVAVVHGVFLFALEDCACVDVVRYHRRLVEHDYWQ